MLVTLTEPAVPDPSVTVQLCGGFVGFELTVTKYALPIATPRGKTNGPFAVTVVLSLPLFVKPTLEPSIRPVTVPPIEIEPAEHVTATLVTSPEPMTPEPFVTEHVCAGLVGWVRTVTL